MRVALMSIGTRGDVQPFIALALGLKGAGHEPTLIAFENFRPLAESYDVNFVGLPGNMEAILYSPEGQEVLRSGHILTILKYMQEGGRKLAAEVNPVAIRACKGAEAIVASVLARPQAFCMAEEQQVKMAVVDLSLPVYPTRAFPFAGMDYLDFPAYNRWTYRLIEKVFWRLSKTDIQDFRRQLDLPPLKTTIAEAVRQRKTLTLCAITPTLAPRPGDWPPYIDVTGYLTIPKERRNEPPPDGLEEWLTKGERPVYIGFGSMPIPDPEKFAKILTTLLRKTRFIFCEGWSKLQDLPQHPNLFKVGYVNHEWLLARCAAAVIHGGAGTVAAALRAQTPPIVVSIFGDQPWWGKIVARRGIGAHIPFKKLSAQKLRHALRQSYKSIDIKMEDGLTNAVAALNAYFAGPPAQPSEGL